jgi:hypothetical protein
MTSENFAAYSGMRGIKWKTQHWILGWGGLKPTEAGADMTGKSKFKVMAEILRLVRLDAGKDTSPHHYQNESRLVNWALSGEFKALDWEALGAGDLALLASLEERNTVLIGRGVEYAHRKAMLEQHALDWRAAQPLALGRAA